MILPDTVAFHLGDRVFSQLNSEWRGMVTGLQFRPTGINYLVTWQDGCERGHYECELSADKVPFEK